MAEPVVVEEHRAMDAGNSTVLRLALRTDRVGKSCVACAFGHAACRKGHRVLYRRVPRMRDELALARADGTYARLLARLVKIELLVLDDWGLGSLK